MAADEQARRAPRFHGRVENARAQCDHPGCSEPGEFRAPGERRPSFDGPGEWRWFCLDHVRDFNTRYNFFSGMSADEIDEQQRPYSGWERETRAFSTSAHSGPRWADFTDPLDAIQARMRPDRAASATTRKDGRPLSGRDRDNLRVLGLDIDADRGTLRRRYSELVRRYHPDRNGGDRSHEGALQAVVTAYHALRGAAAFA